MLSNEEWRTIFNAIRIRNTEQTSIVEFRLNYCFMDGISAELLKDILTSNAEKIYLQGNGLSSREATIVAECLESNPTLATLVLDYNCFDDADAAILANSLSSNTSLKALHFGRNNIKEEGRLALLRAIFDVSSLASCAASNHTCKLLGFWPYTSALNCFDDGIRSKWEKIFAMLALSSKDSFINTALLSGVPSSLMPVLLDKAADQVEDDPDDSEVTDLYLELRDTKRCQKHNVWDESARTRSLSSMYELIRNWVVPLIYV